MGGLSEHKISLTANLAAAWLEVTGKGDDDINPFDGATALVNEAQPFGNATNVYLFVNETVEGDINTLIENIGVPEEDVTLGIVIAVVVFLLCCVACWYFIHLD